MYDENLRQASESAKPKKDKVLQAWTAFTSRKFAILEDEENPARPSKRAQAEIEAEKEKALKIIQPEVIRLKDLAEWAEPQEKFFENKLIQLRGERFSPLDETDAIIRSAIREEFKVLPALLLSLVVDRALAQKKLAVAYEGILAGYSRGSEPGWPVIDLNGITIPGQKRALADIKNIKTTYLETQAMWQEVLGIQSKGALDSSTLTLARLRTEADKLAAEAKAEESS